MLKRISCALALLLPVTVLGQSTPNVTVELTGISPATGAIVPPDTAVYARIVYRTDAPVGLVLRPYRDGRPVLDGVYYSGSPDYPGPAGEGVAWFAFRQPQAIDGIRAIASDDRGKTLAEARQSVTLSWRRDAPAPDVAAWVAPLEQQRNALIRAQEPPPSEDGFLIVLLVQLMFLTVPLSVVLQVIALRVLQGPPKSVAWLSAMAMALLWLFVIATGLAGSNLSPILIVLLSPVFVLLLGSLLFRRWRIRKPAT